MKKSLLFLSALTFAVSFTSYGQCDPNQREIKIEVLTDDYPHETTWEIRNLQGVVLFSGGPYSNRSQLYVDSVCIPEEMCIQVVLKDAESDGVCCEFGEGYINIYENDLLLKTETAFGRESRTYIGCAAGSICDEAISTGEGTFETSNNWSSWYQFIPSVTGYYKISTCLPENDCNTVIWIYDRCDLVFTDNNAGTIFYNDDYCGEQAELVVPMEEGEEYYVRIGAREALCNGSFIDWTINYTDVIRGCTDTTACNFDPLADEDDGSCIFPGDPDCPEGPDLIVSEHALKRNMYRTEINNQDPCYREEGCLKGYGKRTIIRFDTRIENIGEVDYFIGPPPATPEGEGGVWEFDECHHHWHYEGYAEYLLYDENGTKIPIGFKNGFCVLDLDCPPGIPGKYGCQNMGITAGCADIYDYDLDCQWIDITDLKEGFYTMVVRVNWNRAPDALGRNESTYFNNLAKACIQIVRDTALGYVGFEPVVDCPAFFDCEGVENGLAEPDCEGNCNGRRLIGDLSKDTIRNFEDAFIYFQECLRDTMTASKCNDLTNDDKIDAWDAALMVECIIHQNSPSLPGHAHAPCEFPFIVGTPYDSVWLSIESVNQAEQYVDIYYRSPNGDIAAFEFNIDGAEIASAENLAPGFSVDLYFDKEELLGISLVEDLLQKTSEWKPLVRLYYENPFSELICINEISAVVNSYREKVLHTYIGECAEIKLSGTGNIPSFDLQARVVPNPVSGQARIIFDDPVHGGYNIDIFDAVGKQLMSFENVKSGEAMFSVKPLPAGTYFFKVYNDRGMDNGRFVVEK